MRITMTAFGTRGDVQPALALAYGLRDAGHEVKIMAGENFTGWIRTLGFEAIPTLDMEALMQSPKALQWVERGTNTRTQLNLMRDLLHEFGDTLAAPIFSPEADCDLFISGFVSSLIVAVASEVYGIPMTEAALQPYRATRSADAGLISVVPGESFINRWFGLLGQYFLWTVSRDFVNRFRSRYGLPPLTLRGAMKLVRETPLINGYSPHIVPHAPDWTPLSETAGFWFLDEETDWTPPDDLAGFLNAEPKPIYIGFGSMSSANPRALFDLTCAAVEMAGQRAVFITGWSGVKDVEVPDNVYIIDRAPHSWLFERVAGVVHHGGAGTTAASLRAGQPTLIIPHMDDQPFWGHRVHKLGAGPRPITRPKLTAEALADGIRQLVSDADMRRRAEALGDKIRTEDGIQRGVAAVERFYDAIKDRFTRRR